MIAIVTQQYRVVATTTIGFIDPKVETSVIWSGINLDKLSKKFPPSEIFGADPLGQKEIEDGFIVIRHTFEKQSEDGSWQEIDDPRRRITPMTDLERAIDAENRRDFPGDYIAEDDDDEYYDQISCRRCDDRGCKVCEPYQCTNCEDRGCEQCMPVDCTECNDFGCDTCQPAAPCPTCKSLNVHVYPDDTCELCGHCNDCGASLSTDNKDDEGNLICLECLKPKCVACGSNLPDNIKPGEDICKQCDHYATEMNREYHPVFGPLWKRYYRLKYKVRRIIKSS